MNLSKPIIICDENEEIRLLLKDMLTKHGHFHLFEAQTAEDVLTLYTKDQFLLLNRSCVNEALSKLLRSTQQFLIVSQNDCPKTIELAATFGVKHLVSFPYTSKSLVQKIEHLIG